MEWYGLAMGLLAVFAFMAGILHRQIGDVLSAVADRIRYGKQSPS